LTFYFSSSRIIIAEFHIPISIKKEVLWKCQQKSLIFLLDRRTIPCNQLLRACEMTDAKQGGG